MINFNNVAVLIPANNEEGVIGSTIQSIFKFCRPDNLYIVDDRSTDNTIKAVKIYTQNIVSSPGQGKAEALNYAINYFDLTKRYEYILFMDADTHPKNDFLTHAMKHFIKDVKKQIVCVVGQVKGTSVNWLSRYRQWEYLISHQIHKKSQGITRSILVVPGCATVFRSELFSHIILPVGTLTEDMDFTFLMHRSGYSNIVFENSAVVYTQDPQNLKDYVKQLFRWYTGFWQVVRKHNIPWLGQKLDLEVVILASEGLYNGLLILLFFLSIPPLVALNKLSIFTVPLAVDLFLFFLPTIIWSTISDKDPARLFFIPHFYFLRFLSCIVFFMSFFKGYLSHEKAYVWESNRYAPERKAL